MNANLSPVPWLLAVILASGLALLPGCKQKSGEPCGTSSDCDKGLVCCFDGAGASDVLGVCLENPSCVPGPDAAIEPQNDAAVQLDAAITQDASPSADASP